MCEIENQRQLEHFKRNQFACNPSLKRKKKIRYFRQFIFKLQIIIIFFFFSLNFFVSRMLQDRTFSRALFHTSVLGKTLIHTRVAGSLHNLLKAHLHLVGTLTGNAATIRSDTPDY